MKIITSTTALARCLVLTALCLGAAGLLSAVPDVPPAPEKFASPSDATNALVAAAKARECSAMVAIFGPEVTNLMADDAVVCGKHFDEFSAQLAEGCGLVPDGSNRLILEVGSDRWPFPIPLVQTNGSWSFDVTAGEDEIMNRHIGRNEYYAIGVCLAYVKAQRAYAHDFITSDGQPMYAMRLKSSPGRQDGLFWPTNASGHGGPLSSFVAEADVDGYDWNRGRGPRNFYGYYFKILDRQGPAASGGKMSYVKDGALTGGFGLVAYPVRWGESGIMTFIVNQDGTVYERNLGEKTGKIARKMTQYNPDAGWSAVKETGVADLPVNSP